MRPGSAKTVVVLGAHEGCGASVVAAAIVDALAATRTEVTLIDLARPYASDIAHYVAVTSEHRTPDDQVSLFGGHRCSGVPTLTIGVDDTDMSTFFMGAHRVPLRVVWLQQSGDLAVIDFGWNVLEVASIEQVGLHSWIAQADAIVLVIPANQRGLYRAESVANVLAKTGTVEPMIVVVGESMVPRLIIAASEPAIAHALKANPPVAFPFDPDVYLSGTAGPMSEPIISAAGQVVTALGLAQQ